MATSTDSTVAANHSSRRCSGVSALPDRGHRRRRSATDEAGLAICSVIVGSVDHAAPQVVRALVPPGTPRAASNVPILHRT